MKNHLISLLLVISALSALLEQLQSSYRAVSEQFPGNQRHCNEQNNEKVERYTTHIRNQHSIQIKPNSIKQNRHQNHQPMKKNAKVKTGFGLVSVSSLFV